MDVVEQNKSPPLDMADGPSTFANLLVVMNTEESDHLDKVLLEMLIDDVKAFVEEGVSRSCEERLWSTLQEWGILRFLSEMLTLLPKEVVDARRQPAYRYKFALNLLSALVPHESLFSHMQTKHETVLEAVARSCHSLDVDAVLCLAVAAVVTGSMRHAVGRRWADVTEVWTELVTKYAAAGGGLFRPALERLLIGRLAALWAEPSSALADALVPLRRFLVVPASRLAQVSEHRPPWMTCCDLLRRLVSHLLQHRTVEPGQHSHMLSSLADQVSLLMEIAPAASVPSQLFLGVHLLDQSASEEAMTSAVRRACLAVCKQTNAESLRDVTTLLLDACLLGGRRCCHLSSIAVSPLWCVLHRCCSQQMTSEETILLGKQRDQLQTFLGGDSRLKCVLEPDIDGGGAAGAGLSRERVIEVTRKVFLGRTDRPRPQSTGVAPDLDMLSRLAQPWVLLLKHGLVQQPRAQADVLTVIANLCGSASATSHSCGATPLVALDDVIVDILTEDQPGRLEVCALQCLARCVPLLTPPSGHAWDRLPALLGTRLGRHHTEDSLDAAGEAVLALVTLANRRSTTGLADWLATNRLPSAALMALLEAGPGERGTADSLLSAVLDARGGGTAAMWEEVNQHTDVMQVMEASLDAAIVVGTAALRFIEARIKSSANWRLQWSTEERQTVLLFLQAALCSGDLVVSAAAQAAFLAAVETDLAQSAPPAVAAWLTDGTARAVLRLCRRGAAHRAVLHRMTAAVSASDVTAAAASDVTDAAASADRGGESTGADDATLDVATREAIVARVLAESTREFFSGRVGGGRDRFVTRLRRRPEVAVSRRELLEAAAAAGEREVAAEVATSADGGDALEALVRKVADRVQEVFQCAVMDRRAEITIDCY